LTIANGTPTPLVITLSVEDVEATNTTSVSEEPVKLLGGDTAENGLKDLVILPKKTFEILTGKEVRVPITIRIPSTAEPRGRYGSVVVSARPAILLGSGNSNVAFETRIASLFYVRIEGEAIEKGGLAQFGLFNNDMFVRSPSTDAPLSFQIAYTNEGNVHLNPYGRLTIDGWFGDSVVTQIEPLAVMPGVTRMREVSVVRSLSPGVYQAHLELNRGYQDIVDEQSVRFIVIPGNGWIVALIILFILFGFLFRRSLQLSKHFTS